MESQYFLQQYDCRYNKIASAMLTNEDLLFEVAREGKYTFLATGMSTMDEIDHAVSIFRELQCPFELMHCNSTYPMPLENANLSMLRTLRDRYACPEGYSGHEEGTLVCFTLRYDSDIYLYGTAAIGCILHDLLCRQGYTVSGFIDKRFYEIQSLCALPVLPIDSGLIPKDAVIIIAVKNVYEHSRIVRSLLEHGFSKLIYRPYPCLLDEGNHTENQINNTYTLISDGVYIPGSPISSLLEGETHSRNRAFLSQEGNLVTVLIPINALFTDKDASENIKNAELPLLFLYPHIEFVKYVLGIEKSSALPYINYCENSARQINRFQIIDVWRENVLQNRADVFQQMNQLFDLQYEFLLEMHLM